MRLPWIKHKTFKIRKKQFRIDVYDQPGRWMTNTPLAELQGKLVRVAKGSMDELPSYGVFTGERESFANRVIGVVTESKHSEPVAFTALVYLPVVLDGKEVPVLHLGLTMIDKRFRGQRLQGPLFEKIFFLPSLNQFRNRWVLTNLAASPAGIGSVSDYFKKTYPHYLGSTEREPFHVEVAHQVLKNYWHEIGCSTLADFDPETFVVHGSNRREGGGAYQFIKEDPVSRYKHEKCNAFCQEQLDFANGDELLQVARLNMLRGVAEIISRIGIRRRAAKGGKSNANQT